VSTSSSIQVEGSDSGMEQTNEYEGPARLLRESPVSLRSDLIARPRQVIRLPIGLLHKLRGAIR